jgi:SAM-dependent methyltransferase
LSTTDWLSYTDLAWTEHIVGPPGEYADETELYVKVIKEQLKSKALTLLHPACGAGGNDYTFKKHFKVTGVDISKNMLEMARKLNPEVRYIHGDMRTFDLKESFDAVAIPDSIGYMTNLEDLRKAIHTAYNHLKPGGVLLIVAHTKEDFQENNFVYTGSDGDTEITVFENNCLPDPAGNTYEAAIIYLIRRKGKLDIYPDIHTIGLFKLETWLDLLTKTGFDIKQMRADGFYDNCIMGDGKYPLTIFVCIKL